MKKVSLLQLFVTFTKIGAFTIGGGYVMVPAIEAEIRKKGWLSDDELPDIVALSQSAPGLLTVNMSIFAGYRMRGVAGSVVATAGCILAPFVVILAIAMFFSSFKDNPWVVKAFMGVRPVAVAVIAAYFVKLLKGNSRWWQWTVTALALAGIALLRISAIWILLTVMVTAAVIAIYNQRRDGR